MTATVPVTAALLQRGGLPLPIGDVPAHVVPAVVVGTPGAHPADLVQVLLRRGAGPPLAIRALREVTRAADPVQWFQARLPALEPDSAAEYRIEWSRAGRRIATLPADGSWLRLLGVDRADDGLPPATSAASEWPSTPRFGYGLEFFAALTVNLAAEVVGATAEGYRINFYVEKGHVRGPRIDAVVEPRGGDWMCIRPDGIGAVDIRITYRTHDGAVILERAGGVFDLGPDGYAMVAGGRFEGAPPFYAAPTWSTAHPDWSWLNRKQGVGFGRVVMSKLQVQCDIYISDVGGRAPGA